MKLRTQLLLSTTTQLVVLGALFAFGYIAFHRTVVPDLQAHLEQKAESGSAALGVKLDVPLGAADPEMVAETLAETLRDRDLAYLEVQDADGATVFRHGDHQRFPEVAPGTAQHSRGTVAAWSPVSLEGVALGRVQIRYSTDRIDLIQAWARRFALVVLAVWLLALAYSLRFSRAFVAPIRKMMEFSRKVAGGQLTERLVSPADGELGDLQAYLNTMAHELDQREHERARSAKRVSAMQQELLTVSRMAGMAEIASGVLHNVGNVLNSLNTSVTVVSSRLRGSKVAALTKGIDLYREFPGGLGAFLTTDKGKLLPQYLDKVSAQLASENADTLGEMESITKNVQHIAAIVSTQQTYTRFSAVHESLDLPALVDDALHMVEGSFVRHGILLVKDYQDVPTVVTDRHKVLQIVVNLVSNARHALNDAKRDDKCLRVGLSQRNGEVAIRISDNGIGIPAENLERIFQHGFTTKKDGHGFGLHSAANAAGELGGRFEVTSEGSGHGATFTLLLPLAPPSKVCDAHSN